jgi:outer membrane lipase/esterase
MKQIRTWAAIAVASALLAACGGGGSDTPETNYNAGSQLLAGAPNTKVNFVSVVSFGDSLSDAGTYTPATSATGNGQAPYIGGRFTTNATGSTVWVENLATSLGLALTPHEVGFAGASAKCPAAANPALANSCTAYGMGGSRVTDPNGIGKSGGALTVPVKTQIANHLARFGNFKGTELVTVFAGANDVLVQFGTFAAKATQNGIDVAAGRLTQAQADAANQANAFAAQGEVKKAALELAGYVRAEVLAKGAKYVVVVTVPDLAATPFGASVPASARPQLTAMVDVLNLWLRDGLSGQPVGILDANGIFKNIVASPATYGIANITSRACDVAKIQAVTAGAVTDGSSLFCNSTAGAPFNGLATGASATTWFFADGLHPTTGGHTVFTDEAVKVLRAFGWI